MIRSGEWFGAQALNSVRHRIASRHAVDIVATRAAPVASGQLGWNGIETTIAKVPLTRGYRLELLQRHEIPALTDVFAGAAP